jgi:hypothetical protein
MMKPTRKLIVIISSCEAFWALFMILVIILRSINASLWNNTGWEILLPSEIEVIGWRVTSLISIFFVPTAIAGCVGLILKKYWGRGLSIFLMATTLLWPPYLVYLIIVSSHIYGVYHIFIEMVAPILLIMTLVAMSILALACLNMYSRKEDTIKN